MHVIAPVALGAALLAAFAVHALPRADPLIDLRLFREQTFSASSVLVLLFSLALVAEELAEDDLVHQAEELLNGLTNERQFLGWVHSQIGHGGQEDLQDLVDMNDIYELGGTTAGDEWFDASPEAAPLSRYVQTAARSIVGGEPVSPR